MRKKFPGNIVRNGGCIMLSLKASKKKITKFPFSQSIEGNFMSNRKKIIVNEEMKGCFEFVKKTHLKCYN